MHWVVLYDRARIALAEGDSATAIDLFRRAIEVIEQQRSSIDSEGGRIGFVGDKQAVYQALVSLLLARGDATAAFEYVERSKARALVDLLASQRDLRVKGPGAAAGPTFVRLAEAEADLTAMVAPEDATRGARTRSVAVGLRSQLQAEAPELASLVTVTATRPAAIQALLAPGELLLEYYYSASELWVFVMSAQGLEAVKLDRAGLEDAIVAFRRCLGEPARDCDEASRALHDRLLKPVADRLTPAKRLVIVPHGALHYLPFNALHSGAGHLIDSHAIRVEPSASVLDLIKGRGGKAGGAALLLGNPNLGRPELALKHAEEEAVAIAKLLPASKVLLRDDAKRSAVRSEGGRYGILHFASHGQFDPDRPLNSALLLSPEPGSDGRLTVGDLYSLELDANLVTLSACETGLGRLANGDDVVGLTRGLLYAGVSSIVSSLWSVDDLATRDLMVGLYSNLAGMDKAEALRQAQLAVKKQRPHPFFWAAFVLTGNAN
jgi:CHAT domain-containing protein